MATASVVLRFPATTFPFDSGTSALASGRPEE